MHRCAVFCARDTKCNFSGGTTFGEHRNVTCEVGYTVTGVCGECLPSDCIAAPEVMHTSDEKTSAVFPESVEYACGVGYTLDATPDGTSGFELQCLHDGVYTSVFTGLPVKCGPPLWRNHSTLDQQRRCTTRRLTTCVRRGTRLTKSHRATQTVVSWCGVHTLGRTSL